MLNWNFMKLISTLESHRVPAIDVHAKTTKLIQVKQLACKMSFDNERKLRENRKGKFSLCCLSCLGKSWLKLTEGGKIKSIKNIKKFYGAASVGMINGFARIFFHNFLIFLEKFVQSWEIEANIKKLLIFF